MEISPAPRGASRRLWREHSKMVERVNSRVLGDAEYRVAFGVNAPSGGLGVPPNHSEGLLFQRQFDFLMNTFQFFSI